jgi:serine/threonine-protein kinase Chk2
LSDEVKNEEEEGVWGYLLPLDNKFGKTLVLRKRDTFPPPGKKGDFGRGSRKRGSGAGAGKKEEDHEKSERCSVASAGYLIGRHPECGRCRRASCSRVGKLRMC